MSKRFLEQNWYWLTALVGLGAGIVAHQKIRRERSIDLRDKVVLITGGSRGLGLAMAQEFAKAGCRLALCARDTDELTRACKLLETYDVDVMTVPCDVSEASQVQSMIAQVSEYYGQIDVLVNNAGIISAGPWQALTQADFAESMNVMFWGSYNTTMATLPQMRARRAGRIVNITSVGGKVSVPHLLAYASAKFALVGFSEGLHTELAQEGIIVTTVVPGLMRTGSPRNAIVKGDRHTSEYTLFKLADTLPLSSIGVERAARQIVKATRIGQTELIISWQAQILARLHGLCPGFVTDILTLSNRLLPSGEGVGSEGYQGKESETALSTSWLTGLGTQAEHHYNET
ncbi:MAG TPA: SDR family NAD(P)-dependent oxidoreductase [Ktedonobacteraceae bacterium]|nr:SDR family NAD(P)-dependent oxidoreductase [Ktedonobacteraceae bacterium]